MAFLMIEIDESERDFTRFFWDENPGIDLENKRLDIFRMTRVLFGVKSSLFLLAATIKHHLKKYVDIFPDTFNHLNQSLYVDDFLCGNVSVQAALTTCIESKQILEDASMDLRKWRTNSSELNQRLKNLNFEVDEHKESLNTLMASKVLGVGWNEKSDTFYFDSSDLGTFLSKRINTKRYLLQAAGRLFDPGGRLKHSTLSEFQKHQMMLPKATNFKGARNILNEWNEICKSNRIQLFSAEEGIEWNFIPPASPHFGGLWEANIKSMKRILLRVAKSAIMNFKELTTLMAKIEAVLNSRPLSPLSSDPNDLNPLTLGHFLMNCAISSFPEPYTASDSLSYHSRWKLIQSLRDKFWNRWSTEYLTHLQTRAKWSLQNPNLMENQLVLLKDPNTKPLHWPMGRILEVFPGSDGLVRVVNLKTSTAILKRAITKVVPFPIPVDPATVEKNN
ncbi:integrase catalytic domain-containing protein [Trichonephila clavipes]|nr:integrase catalytic domain-containing protein [Trichonephila clavipes]